MSDPDVDRELAANEARAERREDDEGAAGLVGAIERGFGFIKARPDRAETDDEAKRQRLTNDHDQR